MNSLPYMEYSIPAEAWDPDEFGNHRAVVEVATKEDVVGVRIPWRRRDADPQKKGVLLYSEKGTVVADYLPLEVLGSHGDFLFSPVDGPGIYYLYFLPYSGEVKVPYPQAVYLPAELGESPWRAKHKGLHLADVKQATVARLECVDEFNMFTEMELAASDRETSALCERYGSDSFLVFPEHRENSIRMFNAVPYRWAQEGPKDTLLAEVYGDELFVFQLGLYAHKEPVSNVTVTFEDLKNDEGHVAATTDDMRCFNTGGRAWDGGDLSFEVSVEKGHVQPLWCGIHIGAGTPAGAYTSRVTVAANGAVNTVLLELHVRSGSISHHGDDDSSRLARLRWLDSDLGTEDTVFPPYLPVAVQDQTVSILGRELKIGASGLPEQITSYFSDDLNSAAGAPFPLLVSPIELQVFTDRTAPTKLTPGPLEVLEQGESYIRWRVVSRTEPFVLSVTATMEFDGAVEYEMHLTAEDDIDISNIQLYAAFAEKAAQYMTGLGQKGCKTPDEFTWRWDPEFNQDAVWIGSVNGGVQFTFKDKNYSRPLNTNFYHLKPLVMPDSWANNGNGSIALQRLNDRYVLKSSSGTRILKQGQSLDFDMRLLISPFKPVNTKNHFSSRYFHQHLAVDEIVETGANTINIHHCTDINPYINYPFLTPALMTSYIDEAHEKGCKVKLYYTVRELTTRTPEIFALKSLGHEIFVGGKGGGHAWLQEHLDGDYIAAWYALPKRDTSAINGILSRWHNFYVEGMNWLAENLGIDGVYIDDLGFGREIMKRVRRVLHRHRSEPVIDLHSANQYNERDGFASSANLYMEHFPFLDRLWFGEYFDYNENPDYWLVEISGLPFGLMGEMLQDGGNPWRGMVYGMTGRMPRVPENVELWKMWDAYGLPDATMKGYWSASCPVTTDSDEVKTTVYCGAPYTIVALASWAKASVTVELHIDWDAIGIAADRAMLSIPPISGFQEEAQVEGHKVVVAPGKGILVVVSDRS